MIKKIFCICLALVMLLASAVACSPKDDGRITVICTVFPLYDWTRQIVGDNENIEVKLLISDGADLHSYQPTADDIIAIDQAELVVRVGGVSDSFLNELLKNEKEKDISLIHAEGMTVRHISKESHSHEGEDPHDHADDEHIWLSIKNAKASVSAICDALCDLDGENAESYRKNTEEYSAVLDDLHGRFEETVLNGSRKKLLFADRCPFVYLTEDYGIEYAAAFEGCTTEADATFETVTRLASTLDNWKLPYVCVTESGDTELAKSIINASKSKNAQILVFDSMQSVSVSDAAKGVSYTGIMEENLKVLATALS